MKEVSVKDIMINPMDSIANSWMLITAGDEKKSNTMTASWGGLGSLWGHSSGLPVSTIYVRPQRYTKSFIDNQPYYTISFYPQSFKAKLAYLGSHSGKDEDKVAKVGMKTVVDGKGIWYEGAELVLVCRKLYRAPILEECFIDKSIVSSCYPQKDFHDMYIGEIVRVLQNLDD